MHPLFSSYTMKLHMSKSSDTKEGIFFYQPVPIFNHVVLTDIGVSQIGPAFERLLFPGNVNNDVLQ